MSKIPEKELRKMTSILAEQRFQVLYNDKILCENEDLDAILESVEDCFYDAYDYFTELVEKSLPSQYQKLIKTAITEY